MSVEALSAAPAAQHDRPSAYPIRHVRETVMQPKPCLPFVGVFNGSCARARNPLLAMALAIALALPVSVHAQALTPAFTYQGELRSAGSPANASFDMQFRLYGAEAGGSQIGPVVTRLAVPVANGLFSVPLDFGAAQFAGDRQWLEIAIRPAGGGAYETLSPRTEVTAAPYAWGAAVALANSVTTTSLVDGAVQAGDIAAGAVGTTQINAAQVQRRVSGTCAGTQGVQSVNADGTVVCGSFAGGAGTVTSIATGAGLTGGPITASGTISVAPGGIGTTEINAAQVQRRVTGTCAGTNYVQQVNVDGTVGCGPAPAASGWGLSGNAGTFASSNFIGTTDAQAFVVRADNQRVARFEAIALTGPAGGHTANVLLGSRHNVLIAGVRGATIAGGGTSSGNSDPDFDDESANFVTDHYGTVGGGYANRAGDLLGSTDDAAFAHVGGGRGNTASGPWSTVGGGDGNAASGTVSTVGGGRRNTASSSATVGGGGFNSATGVASTVGGGEQNTASGISSTVGGGGGNTASGEASTVDGGSNNTASGERSTVGGGRYNCAGGDFSWAGGFRAKVRPGSEFAASGACDDLPSYPGGTGDAGTFVWADSQDADFVSTGVNRFLVRATGGVGFNTNAPATNFDVVGNRNGHAALIHNTDTVSPDGLAIRLRVATATTANNFLTFQRADGVSVGSVEGNGSGGVVFNTSGGDYAEYLPLADGVAKAALPPGRVVGIRGGRVSLDTDGAEQLGVVSTNPAISGNDPGEAKRGSHALVAFLGQVDVAVAGPVNAGDFLIASGHADGRAIAVPPELLGPELLGEVVGRAWTASTGAEGSVRALVGLNPADAAQSAALARVSAENAAMRSELSALRTQSLARDAAIAELQRRLDQMARERGRP